MLVIKARAVAEVMTKQHMYACTSALSCWHHVESGPYKVWKLHYRGVDGLNIQGVGALKEVATHIGRAVVLAAT